MKTLITLTVLILSSLVGTAGADEICAEEAARVAAEPAYLRDCFAAAASKLQQAAEADGGELDCATLEISAVDDRPLNPYKYVWFTAMTKRPDGAVEVQRVMTQKSYLPPRACF